MASLVVLITVVVVTWIMHGPELAEKVGSVAALLLTILMLALKFIAWWRQGRKPLLPLAGVDIERAKDILARQVGAQWKHEAALRSLGDPEPIPVPWRLTEHDELMDHPRLIAGGVLAFSGQGADIATLTSGFRALRCRRLVILGGPGAGKTTLAMQLLRELIRTRQPGEPIPVLLSAARWNTETYPRLHDWLGKCLSMDYPDLRVENPGSDAPRALAAASEILPILDGLDELREDARTKMLAALNSSMDESDQLILTSRSTEFRQAVEAHEDVLTAAALIEPQPLTPDVAADYLEDCLPPKPRPTWTEVLNALRKETAPALVGITSTPLGLWLIHATYILARRDPGPLLHDPRLRDPPSLRAHLLDLLIPALIESRRPSDDPAEHFRPRREWNPDQVRRWLAYLARLTRETRDLAWWRLADYTLCPGAVRLVVGIVTGLLGGLLYGLLILKLGYDLKAAAAFVLMTGLPVGFVSSFSAKGWLKDTPGRAHLRLRRRMAPGAHHVRRQIIFGSWFGLLIGIGFGLSLVPRIELLSGASFPSPGVALRETFINMVVNGVLFAISGGLAFGLVAWAERPALTRGASSAMSSWGADKALTFVKAIFSGLATAPIFGAVILLTSVAVVDVAPMFALVDGLVEGLIVGLAGGLVTGRHHAWFVFTIAVLRLAMLRRLPRRLMPFLDDAHRLGLLRAVGPIYQFRHAELHDHLAAGEDARG
ncbi:NACHT domain-containing protein [Nonomuraea sp. NPDC050451]|uniref:NACHT domain-containing protein n=1 Tax=Nonomuraea sp. NPDC050451 TaxID=3364364 RepID=UPI0037A2DBFA